MKVLLAEKIHPTGIKMLEKEHEVVLASGIDEDTLCREIMGKEAVIVRSIKVPARLFEVADKLRVIGRHGMGLDNIDVAAATKKGIMVVNTPVANVDSVAEHIVSMVMCLSKMAVKLTQTMKEGKFSEAGNSLPGLAQKLNLLPSDIKGKKLGLIGLGKIGSGVARLCGPSCLGMQVIGYDPYLPPGKKVENMEMRSSLEELLKEADFVSLQVPLTDGTRGLLGIKEFSLMKKEAYIINASRGPVIDEQGLLQALQEKTIAGAALDVFWQEPLPANHPIFKLDNVILTPHVAGVTKEALERMSADVSQGVLDALAGKTPAYLCNPDFSK